MALSHLDITEAEGQEKETIEKTVIMGCGCGKKKPKVVKK